MKKKLNKTKIILASAIGLAAISVGTIGFSTWVIGIQRTEIDNSVKLNVDNVTSGTILLNSSVSETLTIAESSTSNGDVAYKTDIVTLEENNSGDAIKISETARQFTFSALTVKVGTSEGEPSNYQVYVKLVGDINNVKVDTANMYHEAGDYTYLSYEKVFRISSASNSLWTIGEVDENNNKTATFLGTSNVQTVSWGSFFSYTDGSTTKANPSSFYNYKARSKYKTDKSSESLIDDMLKKDGGSANVDYDLLDTYTPIAYKEVKTMLDTFSGDSASLTLEVRVEESTVTHSGVEIVEGK